ncbi:exopolyphosphatase [Secundilactobacillus paracollinoides]|uniref:Exopolyphosphatase n=1 Tax=Secundilactobacillus paracollinoides TaxID=240427 RepID=A0A1B2J2D3_9LACO|nr:exopolyphosphatase [Secundilactobacillus paracollinoides]ANZ68445.1 exopolyphosphatase [Secundilactobacillus paracollinoides]
MAVSNNNYYGAIVVTVQGLDLLIVNLKTLKPIERVHKELLVGDSIYQHQPIDFELVNQMTDSLRGFLQLMNDYDIETYQLWGSEALSHAVNADFIRDQVFLRTGLRLSWLSISEENYYRNQAVLLNLRKHKTNENGLTHWIGINSGNTTITQFSGRSFVYSSNFSLGPVRIAEDLQSLRQSAPNSVEVLNDYIESKLTNFSRITPREAISGPSEVILLGTMPLSHLVSNEHKGRLSIKEFERLFDQAIDASDQFLMEQYGLTETEMPLLLPELLLLRRLLRLTQATSLVFSDTTVLDGLAVNESINAGFSKLDFSEQTVTDAQNIATHYRVEPVHRELVTKFALHLFDQLKSLHQLGSRERLLLQIACILHDVGGYVDAHEHYLHSEYIIQHSNIIGLSIKERAIIAAISRYHSTQTPSADLSRFRQLPTEDRLLIAKLASILRLADALDDDRQQKIKRISVSLKAPEVIITAYCNESLLFEKWEFAFKSQFFEETFGLKPQLKQRSVTAK